MIPQKKFKEQNNKEKNNKGRNNAWQASECAAALDAFSPPAAVIETVGLNRPLIQQNSSVSASAPVTIDVLRLDKIDTELGGNKWFKLKPHLQAACQAGKSRIVSFGGAHSNHLHALAAASNRFGFESIGVVRGELAENTKLSPTLADAEQWGMQLQFVSRTEYSKRYDPEWCTALCEAHDAYLIPEGGADPIALDGLRELATQIGNRYSHIVLSCGTGATLAGLVKHLSPQQNVIGISALKDGGSTNQRVSELLQGVVSCAKWRIDQDHHLGGFAKINQNLIGFMDEFERNNGFQLDPIYNGKLFYALAQLMHCGELAAKPGKVLALNTGGLQGRRALEVKMGKLRSSSH